MYCLIHSSRTVNIRWSGVWVVGWVGGWIDGEMTKQVGLMNSVFFLYPLPVQPQESIVNPLGKRKNTRKNFDNDISWI